MWMVLWHLLAGDVEYFLNSREHHTTRRHSCCWRGNYSRLRYQYRVGVNDNLFRPRYKGSNCTKKKKNRTSSGENSAHYWNAVHTYTHKSYSIDKTHTVHPLHVIINQLFKVLVMLKAKFVCFFVRSFVRSLPCLVQVVETTQDRNCSFKLGSSQNPVRARVFDFTGLKFTSYGSRYSSRIQCLGCCHRSLQSKKWGLHYCFLEYHHFANHKQTGALNRRSKLHAM